jgi:hypothetical protein
MGEAIFAKIEELHPVDEAIPAWPQVSGAWLTTGAEK